MFTLNSLGGVAPTNKPPIYGAVGLASGLAALGFRGKFWNYFTVITLELFLAVFLGPSHYGNGPRGDIE
jgi:hypothetical protein